MSQLPTHAGESDAKPARNVSVDAYRGFVMILIWAEVLRSPDVSRMHPSSVFWHVLAYHQSHVKWAGMSLHDTIQPGFTFLVGVALPYSLRSRTRRGEHFAQSLRHVLVRSLFLILLGIFLRSTRSSQTNFTFEDTLAQIGMGYTFAFLISRLAPRWQWTAFAAILVAYWAAWAAYPAPSPSFDYSSVGAPPEWPNLMFHGFASHWNMNTNLGQAFDLWFLNLFPRPTPFRFNGGGYLTLSFIPTLGTMLLGLMAGQWFMESSPKIPVRRFCIAGALLIAAGLLLHFTGICPIVKRIWTPAWTLFSGGVCFLFMALFAWVIDVRGYRKFAFPLVVVGMNSLGAYLIADLFQQLVESSFRINLGPHVLTVFGPGIEPFFVGVLTLTTYWVILLWMYRRNIYIKL
jgi:heparan-alpha-glucosaminide N-acetyltransferase